MLRLKVERHSLRALYQIIRRLLRLGIAPRRVVVSRLLNRRIGMQRFPAHSHITASPSELYTLAGAFRCVIQPHTPTDNPEPESVSASSARLMRPAFLLVFILKFIQ